jgi:hypothetical protein
VGGLAYELAAGTPALFEKATTTSWVVAGSGWSNTSSINANWRSSSVAGVGLETVATEKTWQYRCQKGPLLLVIIDSQGSENALGFTSVSTPLCPVELIRAPNPMVPNPN